MTASSNELEPKVKVILITGAGRSGSTLLGHMLGQISNWFAIGEVFFLWDRLLENSTCGCSELVHTCPVWGQIKASFKNVSDANLRNLIEARDSLKVQPQGLAGGKIQLHNLWRRFTGKRAFFKPEQVRKLAEQLGKVYQQLAVVTGSKILIDTSKSSAHGYVLQQIQSIDLYQIHLVRDARAVAYSWSKKDKLYDVLDGKPRHFPKRSTFASVADWAWVNLAAQTLFSSRLRSERYQRIRYEDLVCSPRRTVQGIIRRIDVTASASFIGDDESVNLEPNHMVAGNPSRFSSGVTHLTIDDEWRTNMPLQDKMLAVVMSFPWMLGYGYFSRPKPVAHKEEY